MKRWIIIMISIIITAVAELGANLVDNPGFENGTSTNSADNWTFESNSVTINRVVCGAKEGSYALRIRGGGNGTWGNAHQDISVKANKNEYYYLHGWIYRGGGLNSGNAYFDFVCVGLGDIYPDSEKATPSDPQDKWLHVDLLVYITNTNNLLVRCVLDNNPTSGADAYFDAIEVYKPTNIINGSFEDYPKELTNRALAWKKDEPSGQQSYDYTPYFKRTNDASAPDGSHVLYQNWDGTVDNGNIWTYITGFDVGVVYRLSFYAHKNYSAGNSYIDMNDIPGEAQIFINNHSSYEYYSSLWKASQKGVKLRIVSDGTPNGECWIDKVSIQTYHVSLPLFDFFDSFDYTNKWVPNSTYFWKLSSGVLSQNVGSGDNTCFFGNMDSFSNYAVRLKIKTDTSGPNNWNVARVRFYKKDENNYYSTFLMEDKTFTIGAKTNGTWTGDITSASTSYSPDEWNDLIIYVYNTSSGNVRIVEYLNDELLIDYEDTTYKLKHGGIELVTEGSSTGSFDDVEIWKISTNISIPQTVDLNNSFNTNYWNRVGDGVWSISGNKLQQTSGSCDSILFYGGDHWKDYVLSAYMKRTSGTDYPEMIFRFDDPYNYYFVKNNGSTLQIGAVKNNVSHVITNLSITESADNFNEYKIKVMGINPVEIEVYVNNSLKAVLSENQYNIGNGRIGFRTVNCSAEFSNIRLISVPPRVNLVEPSDGASFSMDTTNVVLKWSSISNGTRYWLQVSDNSGFSDLIFEATNLTTTSYTLAVESGKTYYWHVKGYTTAGMWGGWSETRSFSIGAAVLAPEPISPPDNAILTNISSVTFEWSKPLNAVLYHLQLSTDSNFNNIIWEKNNITSNSVEVALTEGKYYWRVKAANSSLEWSSWSKISGFSIVSIQENVNNLPVNEISVNPMIVSDGTPYLNVFLGVDKSKEIEKVIFYVYDLRGDLVYKREINKLEDNFTFRWDLKNLGGRKLSPGVYVFYAEINYKDGSTQITSYRKFIKK